LTCAAPPEQSSFVILCCAHGAESVVKRDIAGDGWRLAFSRPGFVTAKQDQRHEPPTGTFIRTAVRSLGQVRGNSSSTLIDALVRQLDETAHSSFDQLHVWPRDRLPIGKFGFEPGVDEVSRAVAGEIFAATRDRLVRCDAPNRIAQPGETVLDVALVEPSHWFFGTHAANDWPTRWPGGVQPLNPASPPVSRAYYKAAEAIAWSGFDIQPGDLAVEIGAAPGGACQRLLELGSRVMGIDPAEIDPSVAQHPRFEHIRARAGDLPRRQFRGAKWMLVDSNVKPEKTLVTVGNIVTNRQTDFAGLLLTMKLGNYESADQIDAWRRAIDRWAPKRVAARQLARNRCEVCIAVTL